MTGTVSGHLSTCPTGQGLIGGVPASRGGAASIPCRLHNTEDVQMRSDDSSCQHHSTPCPGRRLSSTPSHPLSSILLSSVLGPLSSVLCPLSSVLCPLSSVICPLPLVLGPLSSVLCPLSSIGLPLLLPVLISNSQSLGARDGSAVHRDDCVEMYVSVSTDYRDVSDWLAVHTTL